MPYAVEDANVALLDTAIEVPETELDTEVNVTDPDQLQEFRKSSATRDAT